MNELDKEAKEMALKDGQQALNVTVKSGKPKPKLKVTKKVKT